ncbi:hypothetical protein VIGAN_01200200 [Vigna angularis var. angularis]|uniref:Uncharacterized protein n=1 Tax=Vigna angularis var. angularis TaxID=157739 RepID=A0A0S3R1E4_PHAAN|nr:hypothetical protein VIGAN_01200200 [Vigna angularis var. angularis]
MTYPLYACCVGRREAAVGVTVPGPGAVPAATERERMLQDGVLILFRNGEGAGVSREVQIQGDSRSTEKLNEK